MRAYLALTLVCLTSVGAVAATPTDPARRVGPESRHFSVALPAGWSYETNFSTLTAFRDGPLLDSISLRAHVHGAVFKAAKRRSGPAIEPHELADSYVENLKAESPQLRDLVTVASETVEVAGRSAFRVRLRYRLAPSVSDVLMEEVTVGVPGNDVLVLATFRAPALHYFATRLPDFDSAVATITFDPPPGKR